MRFSIFRPYSNKAEKGHRHHLIHQVWKPKLIYPFLSWIHKGFLQNFMIKEYKDIPDEIYNKNFQVLYRSFEEGIHDWHTNFYGGKLNGKVKSKKQKEKLEKAWIEKRHTHHWYALPNFLMKLMLTIVLEDTAYRELLNCVMFRLQKEMNESYNPEIEHKFPMYINMYEGFMQYFIEWMKIKGGGAVQLQIKPLTPDFKVEPIEIPNFKVDKEVIEKIKILPEEQKKEFETILSIFLVRMLRGKIKLHENINAETDNFDGEKKIEEVKK